MSCPTLHMKLIEENDDIELRIEEEKPIPLRLEDVVEVTTSDYEQLINKPSINGIELIGNYDEIDPTVPDWAKEPEKPKYSADEINAVPAENEMSFAEIKELWDSVFK